MIQLGMHPSLTKSYKNAYPFRLCTTSFIYPDAYVPNVRMLGPCVDEVELLFFESAPESLPSESELRALADLAGEFDLTYNIHLPTDISPCDADPARARNAAETFRRIIDMTRFLAPTTYTLHLPYDRKSNGEDEVKKWRDDAHKGMTRILAGGVASRTISIETLDYPIDRAAPIISDLDLSVCLDIGHLIIHNFDIRAIFVKHRDRTSIIHLHGAHDGRDHLPLDRLPGGEKEAVMEILKKFSGVVSIEVFRRDYLAASLSFLESNFRSALPRSGYSGAIK